jgi:iron complex transport system substrate-binding protein
MNMKRTPKIPVLVGLAIAGLALASCSSSPTTSAPAERSAPIHASSSHGFPLRLRTTLGTIRLPKRPTAIVSLSPSATDMLYAVGAGRQVKAVDEDSTYPADAPRTKLSGLDPNLEAIAAENPDLVVISYNTGNLAGRLEKLGIPVLYQDAPSNLSGVYAEIEQIGIATGHQRTAEGVVSAMKAQIHAIASRLKKVSPPLSYYYELSNNYYSATSNTFIGSLLGQLGLKDIADAAKGSGDGYPQLSAEYIIKENPDLIFLDDSATPKTVAARPGWQDMRAVRDHDIFVLNENIASQWGPRIVDLLRTVAADVRTARSES